jgi:TetR/AcrR family transcriptional repressor of nem operon
MPLQKTSKEEIITKSLDIFRKQGYHRTSMDDLAKACGLMKGSFYYYFDSKEILMKEVLSWIQQYLSEKVYSIAFEESVSAHERLSKMLVKLGKVMLNAEGGCILGNMTLETARLVPAFKEVLKEIFQEWSNSLAHIFETCYSSNEAEKLAWKTIMLFEGAVMMNRLFEGKEFYKDSYEQTLMLLK